VTGSVRTVLGDIPTPSLGTTLVHEHLHMDCSNLAAAHGYVPDPDPGAFDVRAAAECRWNPGAHPDNYRFTEHEPVLADLVDFAALGGNAIVDATPVDLGRDPDALARFSRESGLHVVMGTGYYLEATHRPFIPDGSEESASFDLITSEHAGDGIRPGMIGEIGTSDPPTAGELRSVRGAARAAIATGLPLSIHLHPWGDNADRVIDVVGETGLGLDRVLLNHLSTAIGHDDRIEGMLATGVSLSFDLCGFDHSLLGPGRYPPSDDEAMATIAALLRGPRASQVMISQDVGVRTRLREYGGWGYGHALRHLVPLLRSHGATEADIDLLLVENPGRFLTLAEPR
jgi:phosphotriesterase-related protein